MDCGTHPGTLTRCRIRPQDISMKISQLFNVVLVSSFVAVPAMAAPLPLCGGDKVDKAEKADSDTKSEKKEKKEAAEKKANGKESA